MAKSPHAFNKNQREKNKIKKNKEKRERRETRKLEKSESGTSGPEIDWGSAPVNSTLNKKDEQQKEEAKNG